MFKYVEGLFGSIHHTIIEAQRVFS